MTEPFDYIESARRTVRIERDAIAALEQRLDERFVQACNLIMQATGRVVVTGMGKSGHIARKIAATLASTGTPAFFVHPGEAGHGDLGMITPDDVVIAISYSGSSAEILTLLPMIKRMGSGLIGMSRKDNSPLATESDVHLNIEVETEACPLDLAPTSSTTATLVLGDCLAIALLEKRGFTAEDFAFSHPMGALGRKLLLRVEDIMHAGQELPLTDASVSLQEALMVMTAKGFGLVLATDAEGCITGVFTDGDLRRAFEGDIDIKSTRLCDVMNPRPRSIEKSALAAQALGTMQENKITALAVVDSNRKLQGILHMHDLLRAGVV